jgi:hypothetical protein
MWNVNILVCAIVRSMKQKNALDVENIVGIPFRINIVNIIVKVREKYSLSLYTRCIAPFFHTEKDLETF